MKAWVLHGAGDLRCETVEKPSPESGEAIVQVKAAGVCGSDIPRIYRTGAYSHPLIPGHEFSGVVTEAGNGVDASWLGARVGVCPLIPCGFCAPCKEKHYELCRNYSYLGSRRNGGFAEYASVPVRNLIRLPASVSYEAAAMLEPMAVAVHAMRRIPLSCEDRAVVCGLGTIGLLLVMFLLEAGVKRLLVIGKKEFQRQEARKLGLPEDAYCDSGKQDAAQWILEQTDGCGADAVFECVGRNETCALAIESAAPLGKVVLVGNPFSDMKFPKNVYWKILRNQLTVTGVWNSSFLHTSGDDWNYALERLAQKRIDPLRFLTHRLSLQEMEKGFHIMRDKTEEYGKIMGLCDNVE